MGCGVYIFSEALPLLTVFVIHLQNKPDGKKDLDSDLLETLNDVKDRSPSEKQQDEDDEKLRDVKHQDVDGTEDTESQDLSALDD